MEKCVLFHHAADEAGRRTLMGLLKDIFHIEMDYYREGALITDPVAKYKLGEYQTIIYLLTNYHTASDVKFIMNVIKDKNALNKTLVITVDNHVSRDVESVVESFGKRIQEYYLDVPDSLDRLAFLINR